MDEQNPREDEPMDDHNEEHLVDRTEVEREFEDIEDEDENEDRDEA